MGASSPIVSPRPVYITFGKKTITQSYQPSIVQTGKLACALGSCGTDNDVAVVVSRTTDWHYPTDPVLTVFPRGSRHDGGVTAAGEKVVAGNALNWASAYGTLVTTFYGTGTIDGINERGLAAHLLYLEATDFGPRDPDMPGLHAGLWSQYALDQAATVGEALALLAEVQVVVMHARETKATVHLALEDAAGDSAIIEHLDGKPVVHHGSQYRVMTNDPPYDEQLRLLAGLTPPPGRRHATAGERHPPRPLPARQLLLRAASRTARRARGRGRGHGDRPQRVGAVRRPLQRVRGLRHRVPHRV